MYLISPRCIYSANFDQAMDGRIMTEVTAVKRNKTLLTAFIVTVTVIVIAINHVASPPPIRCAFTQDIFVVKAQAPAPAAHYSYNLAYESQFLILVQQLSRYFVMLQPS